MDGLLEPYLMKAINLLHSSAKDAGDQLKAMLDEAIRLKNDTSSIASKLPTPLTNLLKKVRSLSLSAQRSFQFHCLLIFGLTF